MDQHKSSICNFLKSFESCFDLSDTFILEVVQFFKLRSPSFDVYIDSGKQRICFVFKRFFVELVVEFEHWQVRDFVVVRVRKFPELFLQGVNAQINVDEVNANLFLEALKLIDALRNLRLFLLKLLFNLLDLKSFEDLMIVFYLFLWLTML